MKNIKISKKFNLRICSQSRRINALKITMDRITYKNQFILDKLNLSQVYL